MSNWLVLLLKIVFLFFLTLLLTRIMGKKNLSKLTPFKFICYISISIIVILITFNIITNFYFGSNCFSSWTLITCCIRLFMYEE